MSKDGNKTVIYLDVGKGECLYPELFETLIIVHEGEIIVKLRNEYQKDIVKDNQNIRDRLENNTRLDEAFQDGTVDFLFIIRFVIHLIPLFSTYI
jgi:hypothetical protein